MQARKLRHSWTGNRRLLTDRISPSGALEQAAHGRQAGNTGRTLSELSFPVFGSAAKDMFLIVGALHLSATRRLVRVAESACHSLRTISL